MALVERCVDRGFGEIIVDYRTELVDVAEAAGRLSVRSAEGVTHDAETEDNKDYFDEFFHGNPGPAALEGRMKSVDPIAPGHAEELGVRL
jgi:hypothetical protein